MAKFYAKQELNYIDRKVLHSLRRLGKGNAGYNKETGAATTKAICDQNGTTMVRALHLEKLVNA